MHNESLYNQKSPKRHYRNKFRITLVALIALVVSMFLYFTWLSYQPPAWQQFCEKTTFPDGAGTLWKCPPEVDRSNV